MTVKTQIRKVKEPKLLVAILELLKKHYRSGYDLQKPRVSLTYDLTLEGPDEEAFLHDLEGVSSAAGWMLEV